MTRWRLHMIYTQIGFTMTCSCKQRGSKGTRFTPIDPTGHHLVSGCNTQSMRTDISNRVEKEICDIAKWCGLHVVRQEVGCFKECDPNGKNLRPDISIYNAEEVDSGDDRNRTLVMDVQVTDPIPGSQVGILKDPPASTAGTPEVQADHAYADKNRKYKNVSHQNGLSFSPLIFESTGRMHKSTNCRYSPQFRQAC